jgi:hypothetical protein
MSMHSETVPLEKMLAVIEEYGFKRDMLKKSHLINREISQLYQMIKQNNRLKKDIRMIRYLRDYVEIKEL